MIDPNDMKFGFIPAPDDPRHFIYEDQLKPRMASFASTSDRDLREFSPSGQRHDQQSTSSCVGNAVVRAMEVRQNMYVEEGKPFVDLSRMAVYYLSRELVNPDWATKDQGTYIWSACDVLRRFGVCPADAWPFDPSKINVSPPWMAMRKAYQHKIAAYYRIRSTGVERVAEVARCIQSGLPVVFGTMIGRDWIGYSGDLTQTAPLDVPVGKPLGGHAIILLGTMDGAFIGENSWGTGWGDDGFFRIKPEVIASSTLSSDFWVMGNSYDPWEKR